MPLQHSFEELKLAQQLAREQGLLWTMHVSEMDFEMRSFREVHGTNLSVSFPAGFIDDSLLACTASMPLTRYPVARAKRDLRGPLPRGQYQGCQGLAGYL